MKTWLCLACGVSAAQWHTVLMCQSEIKGFAYSLLMNKINGMKSYEICSVFDFSLYDMLWRPGTYHLMHRLSQLKKVFPINEPQGVSNENLLEAKSLKEPFLS